MSGGKNLAAYDGAAPRAVDPLGLTGAYIFVFETGETYVGKGPLGRFQQSIRERSDQVGSLVTNHAHTDFGSDKMGYMVEYWLQRELGYGTELGNDLLNEKWDRGRTFYENATDEERALVAKNAEELFDKAARQSKGEQINNKTRCSS